MHWMLELHINITWNVVNLVRDAHHGNFLFSKSHTPSPTSFTTRLHNSINSLKPEQNGRHQLYRHHFPSDFVFYWSFMEVRSLVSLDDNPDCESNICQYIPISYYCFYCFLVLGMCWHRIENKPPQRPHYVTITSSLRQNDVVLARSWRC